MLRAASSSPRVHSTKQRHSRHSQYYTWFSPGTSPVGHENQPGEQPHPRGSLHQSGGILQELLFSPQASQVVFCGHVPEQNSLSCYRCSKSSKASGSSGSSSFAQQGAICTSPRGRASGLLSGSHTSPARAAPAPRREGQTTELQASMSGELASPGKGDLIQTEECERASRRR